MNLLWRLQNGEGPAAFAPKVAVMLIGTNDLTNPQYNLVRTGPMMMRVATYELACRTLPDQVYEGLLVGDVPAQFRLVHECKRSIAPHHCKNDPINKGPMQDIQDVESTATIVATGVFASVELVLQESTSAHVMLLAVMPRGERCACSSNDWCQIPASNQPMTGLSRAQAASSCCTMHDAGLCRAQGQRDWEPEYDNDVLHAPGTCS